MQDTRTRFRKVLSQIGYFLYHSVVARTARQAYCGDQFGLGHPDRLESQHGDVVRPGRARVLELGVGHQPVRGALGGMVLEASFSNVASSHNNNYACPCLFKGSHSKVERDEFELGVGPGEDAIGRRRLLAAEHGLA